MPNISRREIVKVLSGLLPVGALAVTEASPVKASPADGKSGPIDEQKAQEIIASIKPAVVLLEVETESSILWGSGFFVSPDGLLITNRHVAKGAKKITCFLKNKQKLSGTLLTFDKQYDLALIKVETTGPVPTVALGDSEAVNEGQLIGVTGYPAVNTMVWMGIALDSSTSRGAVNGVRYGGDVQTLLGDGSLQIDAPVTHGNSGGPVFQLDTGEVIGVLSSSLNVEGGTAGNATFAVPINKAKVLMASVEKRATANIVKAGTAEATVESGDLNALNTIGPNRELPRLFGNGFQFAHVIDETALEAISDWKIVTGLRPNKVTPLALHDGEIFFGATDGKLRQWSTNDMYGGYPVLLGLPTEHIFVHPPAVDERLICVSGGHLDLKQKTRRNKGAAFFNVVSALTGKGGHMNEIETYKTLKGTGAVYGLNRHNGDISWQADTGFVGTPVLYDNKVYYGGIAEFGCLDAATGTLVWEKYKKIKGAKAEWNHVGHASSLGLFAVVVPVDGKVQQDGDMHLFGNGDAWVEAYNPKTGDTLWKNHTNIGSVKERPHPMSTALFVDEEKKVIYVLAAQIVAAVDATSGKMIWQRDHLKELQEENKQKKEKTDKQAAGVDFTPHMVIYQGIIYIGSEDRNLYAFDGENGNVLWKYPTRGEVGHPTHYEGQILVGSSDGYLHNVDAHTGALNWKVTTNGNVTSQPLVHAGMVYAATNYGSIQTIRVPRHV